MAAKKRKPTRPTAKKAVKKATARVQKKSMVKSKSPKAAVKKAPIKKLSLSSVDKAKRYIHVI